MIEPNKYSFNTEIFTAIKNSPENSSKVLEFIFGPTIGEKMNLVTVVPGNLIGDPSFNNQFILATNMYFVKNSNGGLRVFSNELFEFLFIKVNDLNEYKINTDIDVRINENIAVKPYIYNNDAKFYFDSSYFIKYRYNEIDKFQNMTKSMFNFIFRESATDNSCLLS